jgi:hypothetical protein
MSAWKDDPFEVVATTETDDFGELSRKPVAPVTALREPVREAATARFHSFTLNEMPIIAGVAELPGELVPARTTVPLVRAQIGAAVVVLFERGDPRRPIIVGVLQDSIRGTAEHGSAVSNAPREGLVAVQADDDRLVLTAEREIVLRCGEASITLTRAGKVLIKGTYVLSRSSGYNRIKGAAVDIN